MKAFEKQQALTLRSQGFSLTEIEKYVPVSKGSLSRWLKHVELSAAQQQRIDQKTHQIHRRFIEYNQRKQREVEAKRVQCVEECRREVGRLTHRELWLVGAALYWAEGCKGRLTSVVEFVNSDPQMIALMMRWFRECCSVSEKKFRVRIQLHDAARVPQVQQFWSELTGISLTQFTKPMLKISPSSQRRCGNLLPYGTAHLRIADVHLLTRIQGWIQGLSLAPSSSPA